MIRIMKQRKSEELQFEEEKNVAERNEKNNFSSFSHSTNSDSSGKQIDKIK